MTLCEGRTRTAAIRPTNQLEAAHLCPTCGWAEVRAIVAFRTGRAGQDKYERLLEDCLPWNRIPGYRGAGDLAMAFRCGRHGEVRPCPVWAQVYVNYDDRSSGIATWVVVGEATDPAPPVFFSPGDFFSRDREPVRRQLSWKLLEAARDPLCHGDGEVYREIVNPSE